MAKLLEDPTVTNIPAMYGVPTNYDSKITVSQLPEAKCSLTPGGVAPYQAGQVTPFVFATETGLGVKVNWTGTSGQIPDAVHIGFRRKEGALAPIFATPTNASGSNNPAYNLKVPSFVATVDNNVQIEGTGAKTGTIQFFATGDAATFLAMHKEVRQAMIKRLDSATHENANPEAAAKVQQQQSQADQISAAATETGTDNVDVSKLTQIANNAGVGDPSKFAAKYTGKKAADLNKDLKGKYSANVGAMYQNLNK
ncbi:MAG: hypothetical protein EBS05_08540 [Proteobacteria bacterium]|nr:hypothetical protein [Pseudomonadota bacterium]